MASLNIIGKLHEVNPTVENNGYKNRTFVLYVRNERDERFSDYFTVELRGDKCDQLDSFVLGATVEVKVDIRGRTYDKKDGSGRGYFTSMQAWHIGIATYGQQPQQPQQYASAPPAQYADAQPMYGPGSVNYPPTNAEAVARGEKAVIGQAQQGDLPF